MTALPCEFVAGASPSYRKCPSDAVCSVHSRMVWHVPLYRRGTRVVCAGESATIDYVLLRRGALVIYLNEHPDPVKPEDVELTPTTLALPHR